MDDKVKSILQGSVGLFQVQEREGDLSEADVLPGHAQLQDEHVRIELINSSSSLFMPNISMPSTLTAATRDTGAIFFDIARVRADTRGGSRVSTDEYFARALAADVPLSDLRSTARFHSLRLFFPGIGNWAGVSGSQVETHLDERRKLESVRIEVQSAPPQVERISGSLEVTLSTHWYLSGPEDRRLLYAPTSIEVSSRRGPRHWRDLMRPLLQIQNLISLAHGGFVVADGGTVGLDADGDKDRAGREEAVTAPLWASRLMSAPAGVSTPKSMSEVPAFGLSTVGGMAGLRRWLALASRYPRAVGPVSGVTLWSNQATETKYLEVCAAVEHWVNRHKREARWARVTKNPIAALAAHVGRPFTDWTAMPGNWAEQAWEHNGALKHDPSLVYDPIRTHDLGASVTLLLQCALINRTANTRVAGRAFCESHRHYNMTRATKRLLEEVWVKSGARSKTRK